jgi:biotin-(acetyl-CoA carboxylase) ligase
MGTGNRLAASGLVTVRQGKTMGQQLRTWRSEGGERLWLSALIDTMEQVSAPELRAIPCDQLVLAAFRAQLARPATACAYYGSTYSLRN